MIDTTILQIITKRNDMCGFALKRNGGMVRRLRYLARKENSDLTADDVLDTLKYMLSRGWLEQSGQWGSQKLYRATDGWQKDRLASIRKGIDNA